MSRPRPPESPSIVPFVPQPFIPRATPNTQNRAFSLGGIGSPCCCTAPGPGTCPCSPCDIPATNLTCSWTNILFGPGSATLTYTACTWASVCDVFLPVYGSAGEKLTFGCVGGTIRFVITQYTNNHLCNTITGANCTSADATMPLTSHTCSPFSMTFTPNSGIPHCYMTDIGFTSFTITP